MTMHGFPAMVTRPPGRLVALSFILAMEECNNNIIEASSIGPLPLGLETFDPVHPVSPPPIR